MAPWIGTLRTIPLGILLCLMAPELRGEEPTGAQVLFSFDRKEAEAVGTATTPAVPERERPLAERTLAPVEEFIGKVDSAVVTTAHVEDAINRPEPADRRRLAPQSRAESLAHSESTHEPGKLPFNIPYVDSLGTAGTGLVLVVGLFLLCVSLMRRGGPSPMSPLPHDAVAVLGRVTLTPKQFAHLIQVGNKLVLVSITGDRTDTITEITEPVEVERLLTLCLKGTRQSSSADFQKMLAQMAKEPARGFLGREAGAYSRTARG